MVEIARAAAAGTRWRGARERLRRGREDPAALRRRDARARTCWSSASGSRARARTPRAPGASLAPLLTEDARRSRRAPAGGRRAPPLESLAAELAALPRGARAAGAHPRRGADLRRRDRDGRRARRREARMGVDRPRHVLGPRPPRRRSRRRCATRRSTSRLHAANLLAAEERPAGDLDEVVRVVEAVRASPLWKRALAAKRTLVEVPFALPVDRRRSSASPRRRDPPSSRARSISSSRRRTAGSSWTTSPTPSLRRIARPSRRFYAPQIAHYRRYWER